MKQDPDIKKYGFKSGLNHEFEIIDMQETYYKHSGILTRPHRVSFFQILWMQGGHAHHMIDFKDVLLTGESIAFVAPNQIHQFDPKGHYKGVGLIFTDEFYCMDNDDLSFLHTGLLFNEMYEPAVLTLEASKEGHMELHHLLHAMYREFDKPFDKYQRKMLINMLHMLLYNAERCFIAQGRETHADSPYKQLLLDFMHMVNQHYQTERQVSFYADSLNVTEKQLYRACTQLTDSSPKQMIQSRITLEAKRLLAHGSMQINEIAWHLGFEEPTNFVKFFKKQAGVTPSQFRDSNS